MLAGLEAPSSGQVLLDGQPITGPGPDRAVLFQEPALFPWLSVRGNVELALQFAGVAPEERRERTNRWLANVDLEGWADAQPHELSAGMRQRAALARALASDPDVLLGDEPFGALDAQARELLQDEVQRVWVESEGRKTFLFVTHNVREAVVLADRVFVMSARPGRLLEEFRIHTQRPRGLDDVLVSRVVSEIHGLLMQEVDASVAREMAREGARAAAHRDRRGDRRVGGRRRGDEQRRDPVARPRVAGVPRRRPRRLDPDRGSQDPDPARVLVRGGGRVRGRARPRARPERVRTTLDPAARRRAPDHAVRRVGAPGRRLVRRHGTRGRVRRDRRVVPRHDARDDPGDPAGAAAVRASRADARRHRVAPLPQGRSSPRPCPA